MKEKQKGLRIAIVLLFMGMILITFSFISCDGTNNGCDWTQPTPTPTPTPTPGPDIPIQIDDGFHQQRMQFVNVSGGDYLTAYSSASGAAIIAESVSSTRNQWVLHSAGKDYYQIVNAASGCVLAPTGNTAVSGADLVATSSPNGSAQYWKLAAVQTDANSYGLHYTIINSANTGLAVTLSNGAFILSSYNNSTAQRFFFNAYGAEGFAGHCSSNTTGGEVASITGGVLGAVVFASNLSQLQSYASGSTPYTIVISGNISASTLTKVNVGQNKTFIGSYAANTLNNIHFRCISNSGNIIFKNITFSHSSYINANDDIQVYISSGNKFWLDHCTFSGHSGTTSSDVDKFIYVGLYADHVSVTGCKFGIHKYGLILGYYGDDNASLKYEGYPQMTIANCYFDGTVTRAPGLMRYGFFHCYNNFVYDFQLGYTVYTRSNVYSENNYFDRGSHSGSVVDNTFNGKFTDSGSVLSSSVPTYSQTSWRPSKNYDYSFRSPAEARTWCQRYSGAQSSSIVYAVDDF